jgi:FixJ family two-component response regulator
MSKDQPVVFVVDDDASVRSGVEDLLRSVGLKVESFASAQEFLQSKRPEAPGCIVLDVRLPGASGLEFQRILAESSIQLPVIFISGHGDIPMSVRAMKSGAIEFLTKPLKEQELLDAVQAGIERSSPAPTGQTCCRTAGALHFLDPARTRGLGACHHRPPEQTDCLPTQVE